MDPLAVLTPRQKQVVHMVADGLSNKAIAAILAIGDDTIRTHLTNVAARLSVDPLLDRRVAIARVVWRRGLGVSTIREYRSPERSPSLEPLQHLQP
jgi:NarL family two-component system response regulator LiaR